VSKTAPYPSDWRMQGWGPIERMTPKQRRRFAKKMGRLRDNDEEWFPLASYKGANAKNRPTPRRPRRG